MSTWFYFVNPIPLTRILDYNGGTQPIYIGEAQPGSSINGPSWRIQLLTYDGNGNVINQQWAPLFASFGDVWASRAGLTYS